jgi:hypothetical protein
MCLRACTLLLVNSLGEVDVTIATLVDRTSCYKASSFNTWQTEKERVRVRKKPVYSYLINFSPCNNLSSSLYLAITSRIHGKVFSITEYVKDPSLSKVP